MGETKMLVNLLYWLLGQPEYPNGYGDKRHFVKEESPIYHRDPLYQVFIVLPAVISGFFLLLAVFGFVTLQIVQAFVALLFAAPPGVFAFIVFKYYLVKIPKQDVAVRQFFTGVTRYFKNSMVFIPWLEMKAWILPGESTIITTADNPGDKHAVRVWMRQLSGGRDEQFLVLQINYQLLVDKIPTTVLRTFFDEFMKYRLERIIVPASIGDSWMQRIEMAANGVRELIKDQILEQLTALADATLVSGKIKVDGMHREIYMEDLVDRRGAVNIALMRAANRTMPFEIATTALFVRIEDVRDVKPETGWISQKTRASQAQQKSLADQVAADARRDASIREAIAAAEARKVAAQQNQEARERELEADLAVALKQQTTLDAQIEVAKREAKRDLQVVIERLEAMGNKDLQTLLKNLMFARDPEDARKLAEQVKDFIKVPGTLALVGDPKIAELIEKVLNFFATETAAAPPRTLPS